MKIQQTMLVFDLIGKGPILFIGCHPDDIEYGCGGLISKLRGKTSMYGVTLSKNQKNPKNKNRSKRQPVTERAVIIADAPGTGIIVCPAAIAASTSTGPGSLMPGVPASVMTARSLPDVKCFISFGILEKRLCSK